MKNIFVNVASRILRALPFLLMSELSHGGVFPTFFAAVAALAFYDDTGLVVQK